MFEVIVENDRITKGDVKDLLTQPFPYYTSGIERLSVKEVLSDLNFFLHSVDGSVIMNDSDVVVFYDHNLLNLLIQGLRFKNLNFNAYKSGVWYF